MRKSPTTLADDVESLLLKHLRDNHLTPGDMLPKETELAESLHVSRHIVREAINRLKALGLLEAKKRRGTVFHYPEPFRGFLKLAEAGLFTEKDRQNFRELRAAMELGMSDFIFARRTPEKIARLRSLSGEAEGNIFPIQQELDFHTALMAVSENAAVEGFRRVLSMAFGAIPINRNPSCIPPSHKDICDELEYGSEESFRRVMRNHLQNYFVRNKPE